MFRVTRIQNKNKKSKCDTKCTRKLEFGIDTNSP